MIVLIAALLASTPVYIENPKRPTQPVYSTLLDGGTGVQVTCDNCSSSGSSGGGLTDTQLRASPVPVSGTLTCSGPLTDTQLRASPVPVSGPLTDTQIRATPLPVSGSVTATVASTTCNAGTNLNTSLLCLDSTQTNRTQKTQITDGTRDGTIKAGSTLPAASDTAVVMTMRDAIALAAGSAVIGHVIVDTAPTTAVTGTFWQATQPVSIASMPNTPVTMAASSITGSNPCNNPTATLLGISGATSGTTSVQLIAISGSTKIYVCSMQITGVSGTSPTFKLTYGTGSACATGNVGIVGPFTTTANTVFNYGGNNFAVTPAGQALCYIQTGTTPISNYNITYVQQ
jgi:hypothetical protein